MRNKNMIEIKKIIIIIINQYNLKRIGNNYI